ncbi:mucoidy inhibitor MuiA family protein [Testudinibacter sp. TR-2022]|uniref:mucoidy inhibitor MuiA family protein n=1 Tax=Testudinibacter sp. TR-2022 TaxID=2585029 RepID=UPI00111B96DD|nr:mucoidy inhibitor MuiA family protein [Testudinibacter sp. TR-2022]TNH03765.1 mucoidy inhibitor MuiA family protein [Pasteurellaceae bacterium Phil31]TNH11708.1 mucoidy inhibitor MuiA family protein [Testudinibacter sp. TR-2022]TNH12078.1 mucoidy inhibitor MuiA family protein [Testudinibacter sp. TR-2022]TNH15665.1 mucoidy inhibitor MuiA family protein [Testudinibacter sp. TR-2022]TNH20312.1 mucoidy inhibitor MuiA family protein [Testudinibacter sp. TR-2022]
MNIKNLSGLQKTALGISTFCFSSIFFSTMGFSVSAKAEIKQIESQINQVTLYQQQAKIERHAEIELSKGQHELVFSALPLQLDEASLQFNASGSSPLTVLSIDSERHPAEQHSGSVLRDLQQQITAQQATVQQHQDKLAELDNQFNLLQLLQQSRLNSDTQQSFEDFARLQQFSRTSYTQLSAEKRATQTELEAQQQKLAQLEQNYQRLGGEQQNMQRLVRVQIQAAADGKQQLSLAYNIFNASWQPQYQLNYNSKNNQLDLQYGAKIQQNSGEDWSNVKLILSSAHQIEVGNVPEISPWLIDFYQPQPLAIPQAAKDKKLSLQGLDQAETAIQAELTMAAAPQTAKVESGIVASSFTLPSAVSIASQQGNQSVIIASTSQEAKAEYAFYPEFQDNILITVSGQNQQDYPLLGGALRTSYNGRIVGSGYLPTLLPGEAFKQLIGEDQTISVKAEPVKRTQESGGLINKTNKIRLETGYTLQNNRAESVDVVVYDRLPQAVNQAIKVNILAPDSKTATIDDNGRYQQKITLAPNSKQTINKIFTLEYPQDQILSGL